MLLDANQNILDTITGAATRYGVDPQALATIARIESGLDPTARNPNSSASGLFQFVNRTGQQYGLQDPFDPVQSSDAAARLTRDNAAQLRRTLGREPTPGELYLAHQQGATGAARLLSNPNARAVDVVGEQQVILNGGNPNMTAGEFANLWMNKMNGLLSPETPQAPQAPANPVLLAQAGGVPQLPQMPQAAPLPPRDQQDRATRDLLRFMDPQTVSMIPEDQRGDFYSRMRRQMGVHQMAGGNPLEIVQQFEQRVIAPQLQQQQLQQQQQIGQIFSGAPGAAPGQAPGTRSELEARANQYFQAADLFAQQGDVATAEKYHKIGRELLQETPAGQIVSGADLGLDPQQTYYMDKDGKPTPLGPVAGENAPVVNTIHNTFQTISRDNRDQLIAADRALTSLEKTDDFATSTALLNWLTAIGARPRVGADGNYTTESGIGAEFTRIINLVKGGGQLTEQQRQDLRTQISQARTPIMDRQKGLNDVLKAQLEQLNVPPAVINQMIRSIEGSSPETAPDAPPLPPPGTGPAAAPAAPAAPPAPVPPAAGGAPVTITSDDEYDALPSGAVFVGPDGVTRRKP